jgi:hypothetical protein
MNRKLVLVLVALVWVVQLVACMPAPTPTPLPPTDTPVPTVPAAEQVQASAWVSQGRPGWGSVQTIYARLTQGGQGVAHAQVYSIVHHHDADRRWPGEGFEVTGEDGVASTSFVIEEDPEGSMIQIDVHFVHEGST